MIEVRNITKRFGSVLAVDDLSFDVEPGRVTGFLGPNGSGKSTTMRCMLGLDRAERGNTLFDGKPYASLRQPLFEVGALLDAGYVHPGRTARNHLHWMAAANGIGTSRIDEVLALVGLTEVASRRVRGFSLGMRQRLGLAGVLLGDPHMVLLDEPANGLDPEGIRWIRDVLTHLARDGRTVLVSSHLLSEMALMATDLVVVGQGRLIEQGPVKSFVSKHASAWVRLRSPAIAKLAAELQHRGAQVRQADPETIDVHGVEIDNIGKLAFDMGAVLYELSPQASSLEDAFLQATAHSQEYRSGGGGFQQPAAQPPPPAASSQGFGPPEAPR